MSIFIERVATEMNLKLWQITATSDLLSEEATVPFIARYRKEATGGLDEVQVLAVRDRLAELADLASRKESIFKSLKERNLLTDELESRLNASETMAQLEDIYLPFRPKRRTRAVIAKERGLEPLALAILEQDINTDPEKLALEYLDAENVPGVEEALSGARDIIAETVNEHETARQRLRILFEHEAVIHSRVIKGQEEKGAKFSDYYDWSEKVSTIPSHRYLAMRRGEGEGILSLSLQPETEPALTILREIFIKNNSASATQVDQALSDSYRRLLSLSLETELRLEAKKKADRMAIEVFASNLKELLMAPPLGERAILAIDPGFRTGCKIAALSGSGSLEEYDTIQPHASDGARLAAGQRILELTNKYKLSAIAIGNGTAGRETEAFVRSLKLPPEIPVILVNESGASIYSASEVAREEFPDLDLTIRGAISIGRRLMDPLAELVKLDPKSIGVGQYQHDVNQNELKNSLDDVVISCVNRVGVEANTASEKLLSYVSGLGPGLAKNIVKFRQENGPFKTRQDYLKVPRLGPKAFEQCAGFMRIHKGENPLDRSAVHPESYWVVEGMARDLGVDIAELLMDSNLKSRIRPEKYVSEKIGLLTLSDIMSELDKPGRDPRSTFKIFSFTDGLDKLENVKPGMRLPGRITNVTAFGAFVDVGVHQDGLVHLSEMSDRFIKTPSEVVKVGQEVTVTVLDVDIPRQRLSLSLKSKPGQSRTSSGQSANSPKQQRPESKPAPGPFNNPFAVLKKNNG